MGFYSHISSLLLIRGPSEQQSLIKSKLNKIEADGIRSSTSAENDLRNIQEAIRNLKQQLLSKLSNAFQLDSNVQSDQLLAQISSTLSSILSGLSALPTTLTIEETILRRLYFPTITARIKSIANAGFGTFD